MKKTLKYSLAVTALSIAGAPALAAPPTLPLVTHWESSQVLYLPGQVHGEIHSPLLEVEASHSAAATEPDENVAVNSGTRLSDRLIFPLRQHPETRAQSQFAFGFYVDNDPAYPGQVRDYAGGIWTYDLANGYNHAGSDFILAPFHWYQMDQEAPEVIAALGGVVEAVESQHFDRQCQWTVPLPPVNGVRIRHDDGTYAIYLHMRQGSLDHLTQGQRVNQGDRLGQVGSSGFSLLPHLHFELRDADLNIIDPFGGPGSQPESLWRHQPAYQQSNVLRISAHAQPPRRFEDTCLPSQPNFRDTFQPGERVYVSIAIRHQPVSEMAPTVIAYMPNGTEAYRETIPLSQQPGRPQVVLHTISAELPPEAPAGIWRLRVLYGGQTYHGHFQVGSGSAEASNPLTALLPSSRSVVAGQPATTFLTVINPGTVDAVACHIRPGRPFDGRFTFQPTDPASNRPTGTPDAAVDISAGGSQSFVLAVTPSPGSDAVGYDLPLVTQCANSPSSPEITGVNALRISFSDTSEPDLIAIGTTVGNSGILEIPANGAAAFAVAVANVGSAGSLTVRPGTSGGAAVNLTICETLPSTGACLAPREDSITRTFAADETASFAVFARADSDIPFSPAVRRVFFEAVDSDGVSRGSTSVAVRTSPDR